MWYWVSPDTDVGVWGNADDTNIGLETHTLLNTVARPFAAGHCHTPYIHSHARYIPALDWYDCE